MYVFFKIIFLFIRKTSPQKVKTLTIYKVRAYIIDQNNYFTFVYVGKNVSQSVTN